MDDMTHSQIDDMLSMLRESNQFDGPRGFTTRELVDETGLSIDRVRDTLRGLIVDGKIRPTHVHRGYEDGYLSVGRVKGYVLVDK